MRALEAILVEARSFRKTRVSGLVAWLVFSGALLPGPAPGAPLAARVRQPVALCVSAEGTRLFVANRKSGSLSEIDLAASSVVAEHDLGRSLAGVAALRDGRLLAIDQAAGTLLLVKCDAGSASVVERLDVAADPVGLVVAADSAWCAVASRWPRTLSIIALDREHGPPALKRKHVLELPFSPGNLVALPGGKLLAADAFGGKLAVIDPKRGAVESMRSLPAHNIRGLAITPDHRTLVVAHQLLNPLAMSTFEDVHWGSMLSNHLRAIPIDALMKAGTDAELLRLSRLVDLGDVGRAAGDPAGLAFDRLGHGIVALAGVGEVAIGPAAGVPLHRIGVGRRPTAVAIGLDGTHAYVADTGDDSIAVVSPGAGRRLATIALGPRPELTLAERGEVLFHDARLSHDGWMSCHSCHTDGHANGLRNDTLGDGGFGAPKRVPSLLGVGTTGPWTWLGRVDRLEDQVKSSVQTTMRGSPPTAGEIEALTAYLRTLPPPKSTATALVERGRALFRARECAQCHALPDYTTPEVFDVGLVDESGHRKFNPPSLRGVGVRAPLLHDGRARTLEDVFLDHHHPRDSPWTAEEVADLAAFLRSL